MTLRRRAGVAPGALSPQDVAKVAASAGVDPRTVLRAIDGRTRSLLVRRAIGVALREFGFVKWAVKVESAK